MKFVFSPINILQIIVLACMIWYIFDTRRETAALEKISFKTNRHQDSLNAKQDSLMALEGKWLDSLHKKLDKN